MPVCTVHNISGGCCRQGHLLLGMAYYIITSVSECDWGVNKKSGGMTSAFNCTEYELLNLSYHAYINLNLVEISVNLA